MFVEQDGNVAASVDKSSQDILVLDENCSSQNPEQLVRNDAIMKSRSTKKCKSPNKSSREARREKRELSRYFAEIIDSNGPSHGQSQSNEKCQVLSQDFLADRHDNMDFEMISAKSLNN